MKVVLFCGGRGSGTFIKELVQDSDIELTLIVNAYDDGLSTGEIRRLVPGMLGPSDFRKNLGNLLVPASESHMVFSEILEHRISIRLSDFESVIKQQGPNTKQLLANALIASDVDLHILFSSLPKGKKDAILSLANSFLTEVIGDVRAIEFSDILKFQDFATGNILLAGAYLQTGRNFSKANDLVCSLFDIRAQILNVSDDNRILVGLTDKGEFIESEADIVGGQFVGALKEVFLFPEKLSQIDLQKFNEMEDIDQKRKYISSFESLPSLNPRIQEVLNSADAIVYGSGTQHSSLFPTYKLLSHHGVLPPKSAKRIFVSNLDHDLDIQGWNGKAILEAFSRHFGSIPYHELIDTIVSDSSSPIQFQDVNENVCLRLTPLRSSRKTSAHDGQKLVKELLFGLNGYHERNVEIGVFSPPVESVRSRMRQILEEFPFGNSELEIQWGVFETAGASEKAVAEFNAWINDTTRSRFLVLFACEGETNIGDLIAGIDFMQSTGIPVLSGSRTQARRQWLEATGKTYGEGRLRFNLSIAATIFAVFISVLRRKQLLTDPLSRCLIIDRFEVRKKVSTDLTFSGATIPGLRTFLLRKQIDIAEFPITYRVFKGYRAFVNPTKDALNGFLEIMKLPR